MVGSESCSSPEEKVMGRRWDSGLEDFGEMSVSDGECRSRIVAPESQFCIPVRLQMCRYGSAVVVYDLVVGIEDNGIGFLLRSQSECHDGAVVQDRVVNDQCQTGGMTSGCPSY